MPEVHDSGKGSGGNGKRRFINEKVVKPPLTRRQIAKRALAFFCVAVIFGVVAAVSFVVTMPFANRYLGEEPPKESSISIPKDELSESTEEETTAAATTAAESEPIEDRVQSALENYRYTVDDLNTMLGSLRQRVQAAGSGIVVVHSVQQEVDWFDNPVETTGLYAGAVIADTGQELLILTPEAAVEKADSIKVTFGDGKDVDGRMRQKDTITGMAIVSVNTSDVEESILKSVKEVPLGNSYTMREGDLIVAVGAPAGVVHSVNYGFVSYVLKNAQMVDQHCRLFYSDIPADVEKGTFLLNTSGELIGWAMEAHQGDESVHQGLGITEIMGISDYKGTLEKLSNGRGAPYFGIMGQGVSETMAAQGLPEGIYVMNAIADGPAYNAGIQNGDIITAVDGRELLSMKDFQGMMDSLECGQLINVTVERNGRDQYTRLEFQVTVGAR